MGAMSEGFDHKAFLRTVTGRPGVYRMLDLRGEVLYVGKARSLKKRLASYFTRSGNTRTQLLVAQIAAIEVTVTHTEAEALILENQLIKALKPRYNVLLKDDKSYPYIYLSTRQDFPRLAFHRGARPADGRCFGPYPSSAAVRSTLHQLQRLFRLRPCEDSFFRNRSRACLQYQIKRCSGPCVGLVREEEYARDVRDCILFLEGKGNQVVDEFVQRMEAASAALEFEQAARYRDQIASLRRVQERQHVSGEQGDLDIIACASEGETACVQVFFIRSGRNLGNKGYFPRVPPGMEVEAVLAAFLAQHYLGRFVPAEIIVSPAPEDKELLEEAFRQQAGHRVSIRCRVRGERAHWLEMALNNARLALKARLSSHGGMRLRLEALQEALQLDEPPTRMECFDISHTSGNETVASCVVFDAQGPAKADYRRFNITGVRAGDDYAAMQQALTRRYKRLKAGEGSLPDILFVDGGKGQLGVAQRVLDELQVSGVTLVGVAKGPDRRPGLESLFLSGQEAPFILPSDSPALHLVQQIRDEAHRFAITGHRQRRALGQTSSALQEVPGIGPKRRQSLLKQFGGLREVARAGVEDLARVDGISRQMAQQIYDAFHADP